jgi:hypothetical protein
MKDGGKALHLTFDVADNLLPQRKRPKTITYEQAVSMSKPRRCNVPWDRMGGTLACDLCTNQRYTLKHVTCMSSDEPPLFRPRPREDF